MTDVTLETHPGPGAREYAEALARLRIEVFRAFPYLYDGDPAYEREYLETYFGCPEARVIIAKAAGKPVGASTAIPLEHEEKPFRSAVEEAGIEPAEVFYFGESVLLPAYRGRGIGKAFMDKREAPARAEPGRFAWAAFAAVERPVEHPKRPAGYRPLDGFWRSRGFVKRADITASFSWRDLDEHVESPKLMTFWLKRLD